MGHGVPGSCQRRLDHGMAVKYAFSPEVQGECHWTLRPWYLLGMQIFDTLAQIPDDHVLVVSHFAPWWEPLRSWIQEGRPWIEIEYGYWGLDTPRRDSRRVTYCGHHNTKLRHTPWRRDHVFPEPHIRPWQHCTEGYVLVPMPHQEIVLQRTGESLQQWQERLSAEIRLYWPGEIKWRQKTSSKQSRFLRLVQELDNAYAVVGERTMACAESVLLGVPAYSVDHSIVTPLMGPIRNLQTNYGPDRTAWWQHVCWSQFHATEFSTAAPAALTEFYQITGTVENVDRYRPAHFPDHSSELQLVH